jgi:dihydrolipoamide dehydrogenase
MPQGADLVVVGAGPGGYTAALEAAAQGRSVTLVDARGTTGVGGVCLLEGCIPSKALIELSVARHDESNRTAMGLVQRGEPQVDLATFQRWKQSIVSALGDGVRGRLAKAGVDVVEGWASFTGPRTLRVERTGQASMLLEFDHAIVATGSTASTLPALDRADERVLDAAGVLDLDQCPASVVVVGGGYIGVELGTALRKLGAEVTVIEATDRLLPTLDPSLGQEVARGLRRLGCDVRLSSTVTRLVDDGVLYTDGEQERLVTAAAIVVAVGRRPATTGLGLERAGVTLTPSGHVSVDASCLATDRIAAVGDVVPGPALAHKATAEARVAVEALAGRQVRADQLVPLVVFSDPEVACIGLSLPQAEEAGYRASEAALPISFTGRAAVLQQRAGTVRLVVDDDTGLLLGGSVVGPHATELIAELVLAVECGLQVGDLAGAIHPHPTLSELIGETALTATTVFTAPPMRGIA